MRPPAPNTPTRIIRAHYENPLKVTPAIADINPVGDLGDVMREALRQPVTFDRDSLELTIGGVSTIVDDPTTGNEAMLRAYLALVANVRGRPIGSGMEIRHDDVAALAEVLDLTDSDLEQNLVDLLGMSPADAAEVHRRLRWHRSLIAAAGLTVGGLTYFGVTSAPVAAAPESASAPAMELTVAGGYGSLGNITIDLPAPPPPAAPLPPSSHASTSNDDVEIGTALVIERGQPSDGSDAQIGDAITYER